MTANILSTELANIIQDSKKKNAELRTAAEQSLQELKAITVTSEAQLAADLRRKPRFANPLILACKGKNSKSQLAAVSCLQRLVVSSGLSVECLKGVLEALQESVSAGLDVQLKILQALPSFLQNYGSVLEGNLQAKVLQMCITLQQIKNASVSNTASATLQQSVSSIFESVDSEDEARDPPSPIAQVETSSGSVPLRPAAYDAYRTLKDICLMVQGDEPQFIRRAILSQGFGLELIETVLLNHSELFHDHKELGDLLHKFVMPLINQLLSEKLGFPLTVRSVRILCLLLREHLSTVSSECEVALGLLNHALETDSAQSWRRALYMEVFRVIYSSSDVVTGVYQAFDENKERGNVIQDNLSLFVRMASEKPTLIGLGQQSTVPSTASKAASQESAVVEAEVAAGMFGSDFGVGETNVPGISTQWSSMKVPCLEQLDKADGPAIPETYVYSLVLICVNNLSDSLAKIILPLSMHRSHKRTRVRSLESEGEGRPSTEDGTSDAPQAQQQPSRAIPVNPLELKGQPIVAAVASLISSCWPAVLATASTFFNAALDADFYRSLVRSFQKFTQVAGILRLATPRDALLTTLAKTAVPPSLLGDTMGSLPNSPAGPAPKPYGALLSPTGDGAQLGQEPASPVSKSRQASVDTTVPSLTQRNLMCLRALIHLAIALGPILDQSWTIVLESVQKASVLMSTSGTAALAREYRTQTQGGNNESSQAQPTLASEMAAVEGAVGKLMQSSGDYPTESFQELLKAMCDLLAGSHTLRSGQATPRAPTTPQRRIPSVSGLASTGVLHPQYTYFAISKIGDLARVNLKRLACSDPSNGWDFILQSLGNTTADQFGDPASRQMAADVITKMAAEASISTAGEDEDIRKDVQTRSFAALEELIGHLHSARRLPMSDTVLEIHQAALASLKAILEHCGDAVITGWSKIFKIVDSVFPQQQQQQQQHAEPAPFSSKLARSSFGSLQLICSDFLDTIPADTYVVLIEILARFCAQTVDMNISLSVMTVFWNVSDHLRTEIKEFELPGNKSTSEVSLEDSAIRKHAADGSITASWLLLQQRLALLTEDPRTEVRNGSVLILFRTVESCGEQLTPITWHNLLHNVLYRLMSIDTEKQQDARATPELPESIQERKPMNQSSGVIIDGVAKTFVACFSQLTRLQNFRKHWHALLEQLVLYLDCESYELSEYVYNALASVLGAVQSLNQLTTEGANDVAALWARAVPQAIDVPENDQNTRDRALSAYLKTLREIHRLWQSNMAGKHTIVIFERLRECAQSLRATPYAVDTVKETTLQSEILGCIEMLRPQLGAVPVELLQTLAYFIKLPYTGTSTSPAQSTLSYVAFSKTSMSRLQEWFPTLHQNNDIYARDGLSSILEALAISIERKYTWKPQGSNPPLWRKASTTALSTLALAIPELQSAKIDATRKQALWLQIVRIAAAVQSVEYTEQPDDAELIPDETFDLDAFARFRKLLSPYLHSAQVPEQVRRAYVHSILATSTVHRSRLDEDGFFPGRPHAASSTERWTGSSFPAPALAALKSARLGRVHDPPFTPRVRMCYAALDELLGLISAPQEGATDRAAGPLARIAFPFAIVRLAVPLKRFAADQPLRGRMPTPTSQRVELLYILRRVAELECLEGVADGMGEPGAAVVPDPRKAHLRWLGPLVSRALEHVGRDAEMQMGMLKVGRVIFGGEHGS